MKSLSENENFIDYFAIETSLILVLLGIFVFLGLSLGWLATWQSRKKLKALKEQRSELLDQVGDS